MVTTVGSVGMRLYSRPATTSLSSFTTSNQADSKAASDVPSDIPLQPQCTQQQGTYLQVQYSHQPDKSSIFIYGIEECPKGTPKHECFNRVIPCQINTKKILTVIDLNETWFLHSVC